MVTDTRLYEIAGDRLDALVDVYEGGDLFVAETGFARLEPTTVMWFSAAGVLIDVLQAKDPSRRVLSSTAALIVETPAMSSRRPRRAVLLGALGARRTPLTRPLQLYPIA